MSDRTIGQPMRHQFFLMLCLTFSLKSWGQNKVSLPQSYASTVENELKPFHTASKAQIEDLLKGEVISTSNVTSPTEHKQKLDFFVTGIHPRNCTRVMRKLSLYENYSNYIDFIKESKYDENKQEVYFVMDHALLPFPMSLTFKIARITGPGIYPFTFESGFLKGLQGKIHVQNIQKYCLLSLKTDWEGPRTKIPNLVFEMFTQTAGKMGLEHLIRISIF